jgi:hypothetical protein
MLHKLFSKWTVVTILSLLSLSIFFLGHEINDQKNQIENKVIATGMELTEVVLYPSMDTSDILIMNDSSKFANESFSEVFSVEKKEIIKYILIIFGSLVASLALGLTFLNAERWRKVIDFIS